MHTDKLLSMLPSDFTKQFKSIKFSDSLTKKTLNEAIDLAKQFQSDTKACKNFNFDAIADLCVDNGNAWSKWGNETSANASYSFAGYLYAIAQIHNQAHYGVNFDEKIFLGCLERHNNALSKL